eukprot:6490842-Amphidinium_carterae.2
MFPSGFRTCPARVAHSAKTPFGRVVQDLCDESASSLCCSSFWVGTQIARLSLQPRLHASTSPAKKFFSAFSAAPAAAAVAISRAPLQCHTPADTKLRRYRAQPR